MGLKLLAPEVVVVCLEFQTNPCGVEAKHDAPISCEASKFQTNPCGVEASHIDDVEIDGSSFRRTLVGLKLGGDTERGPPEPVSDEPLWG